MKINDRYPQINKIFPRNDKQEVIKSVSSGKKDTGDSVEISPQAQKAKKLVETARKLNVQDSEKIAEIKEKIEQGIYEMDNKKLAEIMLKRN